MKAAWQTMGPDHYQLSESPFWHSQEKMLYWVDILGKKILRANINVGTVESWTMPSEPGCIAPANSGGLVIALRHGVFRARAWGGALELIAKLPYDCNTVRANDGKCDVLGRFWIGTIDETKARRAAELFSLDCRSEGAVIARQVGDALTANGLAWSPQGTTLYWADTPAHVVHAWNFEAPDNRLSHRRVHLKFDAKPANWSFSDSSYMGRPDGAAVDAAGNYWVAMFEGRRVCCFSPAGELLHELETPLQCPTMPCFGGEDLKTLYITSARHGRSEAELAQFPDSGSVFFTSVETPGLPVNFFSD